MCFHMVSFYTLWLEASKADCYKRQTFEVIRVEGTDIQSL